MFGPSFLGNRKVICLINASRGPIHLFQPTTFPKQLTPNLIQGVPLATEPGWLADRCSVSQQLGALQTHTTDTFLFISHTTKVPLFKFRCYVFIGVRIIKEMPGSLASATSYI
jgi:hypothetical protein